MKTNDKSKRKLKKVLIISVSVLVVILCCTLALFINEIRIISSIKKVSKEKPIYFMQVNGDYHFDEFLKLGGAMSDSELSVFLSNKMSKGFYTVDIENTGLACSTISAKNTYDSHVWGRNFDWTGSVPIIVKSVPKDGYSSISTCDFQNITSSTNELPEGIANKMLSIAALYVPMDGVNEAGLCVADLQVNEGGMVTVDTDKTDLTITTAIRLLLNNAATVDEAVNYLKQFDIYSSGGISHHIAISDKSGASVVVEFMESGMTVVETNAVTNFNIANGNKMAGGESAKQRYETLCTVHDENDGVLTGEQVKDALKNTSQLTGEWTTQWSMVYEQDSATVNYYFNGNYEKPYTYSVVD